MALTPVAFQAEMDNLYTEQTTGELRLLELPKELEQRAAKYGQSEQDL